MPRESGASNVAAFWFYYWRLGILDRFRGR